MPFATTAAIIGIGLGAAGATVGAVGAIKSGNAAAKAGEQNAQAALSVGEANAQQAIEEAGIRETQQRTADRRILAQGRAIVGASGVDVGSGSPLLVMAENARQAEMDALIIRRGGALDAASTRREAALEAQFQRTAGANAKRASRYQAGTTLLTGGSTILGQVGALRK